MLADVVSAIFSYGYGARRDLHSFPTRRSSDLAARSISSRPVTRRQAMRATSWISSSYDRPAARAALGKQELARGSGRSEEHTSELQSHVNLVCRLLLEKKKKDR